MRKQTVLLQYRTANEVIELRSAGRAFFLQWYIKSHDDYGLNADGVARSRSARWVEGPPASSEAHQASVHRGRVPGPPKAWQAAAQRGFAGAVRVVWIVHARVVPARNIPFQSRPAFYRRRFGTVACCEGWLRCSTAAQTTRRRRRRRMRFRRRRPAFRAGPRPTRRLAR